MTPDDFHIGQTLDNGALVIAVKPEGNGSGSGRLECFVILALVNGADAAAARDPYATWIANKENSTFHGHYFGNFADAAKDFIER